MWISCSVEESSETSTWVESQRTHKPPVKPMLLAWIAPSNWSLSVIFLALRPLVFVLVMIIIAGWRVWTRLWRKLWKEGFRAPWKFQITILIIKGKKKKKKLKTGGKARLLRGRGLTCFFNLHTVSKHILVYLRGEVSFNLLDHLILILFRIWAWTLLSSFLRQPYLGINSL